MQDLQSIQVSHLSKGSDGKAKVSAPKPVKFKFLTGDMNWLDHGGKWISPKFNNGDFDYWFVRELMNMEEELPEGEANDYKRIHGGKYACRIVVVAPSQFVENHGSERLIKSYGMETDKKWEDLSDEMKVEMVNEYGCGVTVAEQAGSNYKEIFKFLGQEAARIEFLFGFYMDRTVNMVGATGWDWIKGNHSPSKE